MNVKTLLHGLLSLVLVGILTDSAAGWSLSRTQEGQPISSSRSEFRYLIFSNGLLHDSRMVFVLLEEESFSEETLKKLFGLVSKRFPNPTELHVAVYSNLDQIPTPEEEDAEGSLSAEVPADPRTKKHRTAVYVRRQGSESFTYAVNGTEKTVVLKGTRVVSK